MSDKVTDPTSLTKIRLKELLVENNIDLPSSDSKKEVYVDLFAKHLSVSPTSLPPDFNFSSDDEVDVSLISSRKKKSSRRSKVDVNRNAITKTTVVNGNSEITSVVNDEAKHTECLEDFTVEAANDGKTRRYGEHNLHDPVDNVSDQQNLEPVNYALQTSDGVAEDQFSDEENIPDEKREKDSAVKLTKQTSGDILEQSVKTTSPEKVEQKKETSVTKRVTRSSKSFTSVATRFPPTSSDKKKDQPSKKAEGRPSSQLSWLKISVLVSVFAVVTFLLYQLYYRQLENTHNFLFNHKSSS